MRVSTGNNYIPRSVSGDVKFGEPFGAAKADELINPGHAFDNNTVDQIRRYRLFMREGGILTFNHLQSSDLKKKKTLVLSESRVKTKFLLNCEHILFKNGQNY